MAVDDTAGRRGMSRRELIRNAGIAGAAAWTAPVILQSAAVASEQCSPVECTQYFSAKWESCCGNTDVICDDGVPEGTCVDGGLSGDPTCPGSLPAAPAGFSYMDPCGNLAAAGMSITCTGSGPWQFTLTQPGHLISVFFKKGGSPPGDCQNQVSGECTTSAGVTNDTPSHVVAAWCIA